MSREVSPRKSLAAKRSEHLENSRNQHLALLAFRLGSSSTEFPIMAEFHWVTADANTQLPVYLLKDVEHLKDITSKLKALIATAQRDALHARVSQAAEETWDRFAKAWCDPSHKERMELRDASEAEMFPRHLMLEDSPFKLDVWQRLQSAIDDYTSNLPAEIASWIRLGSAIAAALGANEERSRRGIATLENQLSGMRDEELVAGLVGCRLSDITEVVELRDTLLARLAQTATVDAKDPQTDDLPKVGKEARAMAFLVEHPDWTNEQIANAVPCSRTSLYKMKKFCRARAVLKSQRNDRPRGTVERDRAGNQHVDGIDNTDPADEANDG
jgi:hypothetical protein